MKTIIVDAEPTFSPVEVTIRLESYEELVHFTDVLQFSQAAGLPALKALFELRTQLREIAHERSKETSRPSRRITNRTRRSRGLPG